MIKFVSDFSPREREIFETEYPTIDIQVDTLAKICTLLKKESKIAAKYIANYLG